MQRIRAGAICLALVIGASLAPGQVLPSSTVDSFETDSGWTLFEEVVHGNVCYGEGIGTSIRSQNFHHTGNFGYLLWPNSSQTLLSNRLIAFRRLANAGTTGRWTYSAWVYIPPSTDLWQTGPDIAVQNTRETSPGVFDTRIGSVFYLANPFDSWEPGTWGIWTEAAPGQAGWMVLTKFPLERDKWYRLVLEMDFDRNVYVRFAIYSDQLLQSVDLGGIPIASQDNFSEAVVDVTLEAENLWNGCGAEGVRDAKIYFDDVSFVSGVTQSAVSVSPRAGSGVSQAYSFVFRNGLSSDIEVANILINQWLDGRQGCYLGFHRPSGTLFLVNDNGDGVLPGIALPGAASVANSYCSINGAASSVQQSGADLVLNLAITFNSVTFAGSKTIFMAARSATNATVGWQNRGVWNVPPLTPAPITLVNFTPQSGNGRSSQIAVTFRRNGPASQFSNVSVLLNSSLDGRYACWVGYDPPSNGLFLVGNDGGTLLAPITPGSASSRQNRQCRILGQGSSITVSGTDLTLTLQIEFLNAFSYEVAYTAALAPGESSGWIRAATWSSP